jgi:hypothetical protein
VDWLFELLIIVAWVVRLRSPGQQMGLAEAPEIQPSKVAISDPQFEKGGR